MFERMLHAALRRNSRARAWVMSSLFVLRHHWPLWLVLVLQVALSWAICALARRPLFVGLRETYGTFLSAIPLYGAGLLAVALVRERVRFAARESPRVGYAAAWASIRVRASTQEYYLSVTIAFAVLPLSLAVFSAAKRAIPVLRPFTWDARLEHIGRLVHGGRHAWQWLAPLLGIQPLVRGANWFYHVGWPFAIFGAAVVVSLCPPSRLRMSYLVASVATWCFAGTICAYALSSAGPPYFAAVTGAPSPYAGLFATLQQSGVPALNSQAALWTAYVRHVDQFGFGISAMPSVHVATATLLACLGRSVHRVLGWIFSVGALLTWLASIGLGWHYALDGYVGAVVALVVWWSARRLCREPRHALRSGGECVVPLTGTAWQGARRGRAGAN